VATSLQYYATSSKAPHRIPILLHASKMTVSFITFEQVSLVLNLGIKETNRKITRMIAPAKWTLEKN
jgi:hypothetical protein